MSEQPLAKQLDSLTEQLLYLLPEGLLVLTLVVVLLLNIVRRGRATRAYGWLTLGGTLLAMAGLFILPGDHQLQAFGRLFLVDEHSNFVRGMALLGLFLAVLLSLQIRRRNYGRQAEHYGLLLGLTLGAMFLGSSTHLLMVYLSLETLSLSAYLATHLRGDRGSAESSFKYLLFGALSSAMLLYSLSWVYGVTGTLYPLEPGFWEALNSLPLAGQVVLALGVTFGIAFKISAAPAHLWAPDVYETAPLPTVALFSVVPKIAAATLLLRIGLTLGGETSSPYWEVVWPILISATLLVGNLGAIRQAKAMRLMAYSSIAHSGFLLLAVLAINSAGAVPFRTYSLVYLLMNFAAFGLIKRLIFHTGTDEMSQWKGWGKFLPAIGIFLVVVMVALVGLPPTAGFFAKLITLSAIFAMAESAHHWVGIAGLIGLFSTVVALFYYLKIPYFLFFQKSESFAIKSQAITYREMLVGLLTILLLIGFFQSDLLLWGIELITKTSH